MNRSFPPKETANTLCENCGRPHHRHTNKEKNDCIRALSNEPFKQSKWWQ